MSAPIVLAAGGTGGHVFPAQALAKELVARRRRVILITDSARGQAFAERFPGVEVYAVAAASPTGRSALGKIAAVGALGLGVIEAVGLLRQLRPAVVVGFGGFPSFPGCAAALFTGTPLCLHEQNAVLGRANKWIASRAKLIATSFATTKGLPEGARMVVTGNPVRDDIQAVGEVAYRPIDADGPIEILVFGGSQGARVFSEVVPAALRLLPGPVRARLRIVQQVRPQEMDMVRAAYGDAKVEADLRPFFDDMPKRYAQAQIVIARGGASTIAEIMAAGRPALIAPYPHHADQHQLHNAMNLVNAGAGWVLPDALMTPASLGLKLATLFCVADGLAGAAMAAKRLGVSGAAARLADAVEGLAFGATFQPAPVESDAGNILRREAAR